MGGEAGGEARTASRDGPARLRPVCVGTRVTRSPVKVTGVERQTCAIVLHNDVTAQNPACLG